MEGSFVSSPSLQAASHKAHIRRKQILFKDPWGGWGWEHVRASVTDRKLLFRVIKKLRIIVTMKHLFPFLPSSEESMVMYSSILATIPPPTAVKKNSYNLLSTNLCGTLQALLPLSSHFIIFILRMRRLRFGGVMKFKTPVFF